MKASHSVRWEAREACAGLDPWLRGIGKHRDAGEAPRLNRGAGLDPHVAGSGSEREPTISVDSPFDFSLVIPLQRRYVFHLQRFQIVNRIVQSPELIP